MKIWQYLSGAILAMVAFFVLPARGQGRLLDTVHAGTHTLTFDGAGLSSGLYFARLEAAGLARTRKLVLLK